MSITYLILFFLLVRVILTILHTQKAISIIYSSTNWKELENIYDLVGIGWPIRVLSFHKWTFNQTFPELKND